MYCVDDFQSGDIVYVEWETITLRSNVGIVIGRHAGPYMYGSDENPSDRAVKQLYDRAVLVNLPGFTSPRAFRPSHKEIRPATEEEKRQYFADKLKYGE